MSLSLYIITFICVHILLSSVLIIVLLCIINDVCCTLCFMSHHNKRFAVPGVHGSHDINCDCDVGIVNSACVPIP